MNLSIATNISLLLASFYASSTVVDASKFSDEIDGEIPSWLFVQTADKCIFQKKDSGYRMKSKFFAAGTTGFTDRPLHLVKVGTISDAFEYLPGTFMDGEAGAPNAAWTLENEGELPITLVAYITKAIHKEDGETTTYVYGLDQSDSQKEALSLETIFNEGDDKVTFDSCSVFIDSVVRARVKSPF